MFVLSPHFLVLGLKRSSMTTNGESTEKQLTPEQVIHAQAEQVQELGIRVGSLLRAAIDAYQSFLWESTLLFDMIVRDTEQPNDNRTTDSATTQAST